jgi:Serpin (serine protease inhibitor)
MHTNITKLSSMISPVFQNKGHVISPFGFYSALSVASQFLNKAQLAELARHFDIETLQNLSNPFCLEKNGNHDSTTFQLFLGNKNAFDRDKMVFICDGANAKQACQFVTETINQIRSDKSSAQSDDPWMRCGSGKKNNSGFDNMPIVNEDIFKSNFKSCIINDLYFAGDWYGDEDKLNFKIASAILKPIKAMRFSGEYDVHISNDGTIVFKINCQHTYTLYVKFNPNKVSPIDEADFQKPMTEYKLERIVLPYFSVDAQDFDVTKVFQQFLPLCCQEDALPYYIGQVLQSCKLEADKDGFQARAITKIIMLCGCGMPVEKPKLTEIVVDSPFSFALTKWDCGVINLMSGIIGPDSFGLVDLE